jgi:5'-nucleotidase
MKSKTPKSDWDKEMSRLRSRSRLEEMRSFVTPKGRLCFVHFNDVYNIQERAKREPCGGAARFTTLVKKLKKERGALVLFSGDCLAPSIMSTVTKGAQMPIVMNHIGVDVAVYGNHDFDFGIGNLEKRARECKFPWLISNVLNPKTKLPLANGISEHVLNWQGNRIGIIGLVEKEWLATLSTIDEDDVVYENFVKCARRLAYGLRRQGVHFVVALTHMRKPNDIRLAKEAPEVDLILGGHDHNYVIEVVNGRQIVKSGTDFRDLTTIEIDFDVEEEKTDMKIFTTSRNSTYTLSTTRHSITKQIEPDKDVETVVNRYQKVLGTSFVLFLSFFLSPPLSLSLSLYAHTHTHTHIRV